MICILVPTDFENDDDLTVVSIPSGVPCTVLQIKNLFSEKNSGQKGKNKYKYFKDVFYIFSFSSYFTPILIYVHRLYNN
jgi:hypothetical protein